MAMRREIFSDEHELFREQFGKFLEKEVVPYYDDFEKQGRVSREVWKKAGENGFLCPWLDEEYGGAGADFLYSAVEIEELSRLMISGFAMWVHSDIIVPYIANYGNHEQKMKWLPGCASGETIGAVAMTEPDAGSDLQALRSTAVRDGEHYIINGQKTFITNGASNDLVIVAAKTDPKAQPAYKGISLIVVEAGTEGYTKGRVLEKLGWHAQDTAELIFEDCRVPVANRLGEEGHGFIYMMKKLQQERLCCAINSTASMWAAIRITKEYIKERKAFGKAIADFQNTRFKFAEMCTAAEVTQAFLDRLIREHVSGNNIDTETAMIKYWSSENLKKIVDECLQLFGGYGYMEEYPIARAYRDSRVHAIYAGTTEIMKEIISKNRLK